jgi:CBS-domain-containing membrane protein
MLQRHRHAEVRSRGPHTSAARSQKFAARTRLPLREAAASEANMNSVKKASSTRTGAARDWRQLRVGEIMQRNVVTVAVDTPLSDIERLLVEHRIGGMPVTDERGHIVGVLSLRDIIDHYTQDPDTRPRRGKGFYRIDTDELDDSDYETFDLPEESEDVASDVMTSEALTINVDAPLRDVARMMVEHQVHRLVVEDQRRTVGIVSTMDLLRAAAK